MCGGVAQAVGHVAVSHEMVSHLIAGFGLITFHDGYLKEALVQVQFGEHDGVAHLLRDLLGLCIPYCSCGVCRLTAR